LQLGAKLGAPHREVTEFREFVRGYITSPSLWLQFMPDAALQPLSMAVNEKKTAGH